MYRYLVYLILLNLLGGIWLPVLLHAQDPVELVDARTTTQKRYLNPDGSYTARFYSNPVHYLASNGNYHEIDSQIQLSTRLGYDYEVKKGIYQACFKADPTAENSVLISLRTGEKIGFRFVGAGYYDPSTRNYQLFTNTQPAQVSVDDNIITYANMLPGIKMRLRYLGNRLKEDLIITQQARSAMPPPSQFGLSIDSAYAAFIMQIELDSLLRVYRQDGGEIGSFQNGIRVIDFEGFENLLLKRLGREASFFLPLDYAYLENAADSLVSNYYQLKRRIVTHNGKVYVITGVPYTWLTALPEGDVVLDPTFSVSPGAVDDTWLELNSVKGYQPLLIIGKHINYPKKRTLLKFDISSIPGSADIQSADLKVYYYGKHRPSGSTETFINRTVKAHAVLTSWNEYYATVSTPWSTNYGSFGTDYYYDPYASVVFDDETGVWKSFNLTVLASEWHDNTLANNGVLLWATNEDSVGYDLRMYSAEETEYVNYRPYLEVTYTLPLNKFFYVKDHLGSTRAVIDSSGAVKESYDYYPFGLEMPGRIFVQGTADTRNKFTGKERDEETNWDYFGARYYDPAIGRWMAVDTYQYPSWSPYNYVYNNPVSVFDTDGRKGKDVTKFIQRIDGKYQYFWGGKFPNHRAISIHTDNEIKQMSLALFEYGHTLYTLTEKHLGEGKGVSGGYDLGYDCSGLACAANNANPDRSHDLDAGKMTVEGIYNFFMENKSDYSVITDPGRLDEGDFLISKSKKHIVLVVRDPDSGKLVIAEAMESGKPVGTGNRTFGDFENLMKQKKYIGFHDKGNDLNRRLKKQYIRWWNSTFGDFFEGWGAEYGATTLPAN